MNKFFSAMIAAGLGFSLATTATFASATEQKKSVKSTQAASKAKPAKVPEPDVTGMSATEYVCDKGQKIQLYRNPANAQEVILGWNKRKIRMTRVETESGADRLENQAENLTWIGVPEKSMLLDAKKGQRLVTDCKQ